MVVTNPKNKTIACSNTARVIKGTFVCHSYEDIYSNGKPMYTYTITIKGMSIDIVNSKYLNGKLHGYTARFIEHIMLTLYYCYN